MTHKIMNAVAIIAISGLATVVTPAAADSVGYVGLTFAFDNAENSADNDKTEIKSGILDAAYAFQFGAGNTVVIEGKLRTVDYTDVFNGAEIEDHYQIGVHYWKDFNSRTKLGGFLAYGEAPHSQANENYKMVMLGGEILYKANENMMLFGQLGLGDSPGNANLSSHGFDGGSMARFGMVYTGLQRTAITLEGEFARSSKYEDADEPGAFYSLSLMGETSLNASNNLHATYGVRYSTFDARGDDDSVKETTAFVGVRYLFGAQNKPGDLARAGIIGLPYTPLRASVWTPVMD